MSKRIFIDWCEKNGVICDFVKCKTSVDTNVLRDTVETNAEMLEVLEEIVACWEPYMEPGEESDLVGKAQAAIANAKEA